MKFYYHILDLSLLIFSFKTKDDILICLLDLFGPFSLFFTILHNFVQYDFEDDLIFFLILFISLRNFGSFYSSLFLRTGLHPKTGTPRMFEINAYFKNNYYSILSLCFHSHFRLSSKVRCVTKVLCLVFVWFVYHYTKPKRRGGFRVKHRGH